MSGPPDFGTLSEGIFLVFAFYSSCGGKQVINILILFFSFYFKGQMTFVRRVLINRIRDSWSLAMLLYSFALFAVNIWVQLIHGESCTRPSAANHGVKQTVKLLGLIDDRFSK